MERKTKAKRSKKKEKEKEEKEKKKKKRKKTTIHEEKKKKTKNTGRKKMFGQHLDCFERISRFFLIATRNNKPHQNNDAGNI
jgi:hypothetical protein